MEKARWAALILCLGLLSTFSVVLADSGPSFDSRGQAPRAVSVVFQVDPPATVWRRTVEGQVNLLGPSDETVTIGLTPSEAAGKRELMVEFRVPLWFGEWVSPPEFLKVSDLQTYGKFPTLGRRTLSLSGWQRFQVKTRRHAVGILVGLLFAAGLAALAWKRRSTMSTERGGLVISGFRVRTKIGEGAMGEVFRAVDRDGVSAALKLLRPLLSESREFRAQFDRELSIYSKLKHPQLPTLLAFGYADDGRSYMATEYLAGQTLKQKLPARKKERQALALEVLRGVGSVLDYLHESGLVHQDVKPSNIFLTVDGEVKLLDLGVARRLDTKDHKSGAAGTPAYMAPEQFEGKAVAASDQYGLGLVIFEVLTGGRPTEESDATVLAHKRISEPAPPTNLSVEIDACLSRMLDPDPRRRFSTCEEACRALEAALDCTRSPEGRPGVS